MAFLEVNKIALYYDKVQILRSITFRVEKGEILSIVGSNGAGKTSTLKAISGLVRIISGSIEMLGRRFDHLSPHEIVEMGIIHVPEGRKLFAPLTVMENLDMGSYCQRAKRRRSESMKRVFARFPRLEERRHQLAGKLSGGEQQMLAIARGLMACPDLLMLDEPSLGLAPLMVEEIFKVIQEINQGGTTMLIVEQNIQHSLKISRRGYVMENGELTLEGTGQDLIADERVKQAYIGL